MRCGHDFSSGCSVRGPERAISESRWKTTATGRSGRLERRLGGASRLLGRDTVRRGAGVELDDRVGAGPEVDDLAHPARERPPRRASTDVAGRVDAQLLRAYGELAVGAEHPRAASPPIRLEVPTKPATNGLAGRLVELDRGGDLLDPALVEHRDPVAHRERLLLVVGDEDERDADVALDLLELELHLAAQLEVEGAERLVEQQHLGPVDQRAGQRDPLPLAAGELVRPPLAVPLEPDGGQRLLGPAAALLALDLLDPQAVLDVRRARPCAGRSRSPGRRCSRRARCGGRSVTSLVAEQDRPAVGRSKPATSRSTVVLPEPEGPSIEKNSPSAISRSRSSTARTSPKCLLSPTCGARAATSGAHLAAAPGRRRTR